MNAIPLSITTLARISAKAREGLQLVAAGETQTMAGWLLYGAALNEGRKLFAGDREFGRWVKDNVHSQVAIAPDDQAAAIWAAASKDTFEATRKLHPRVRTVRGIHAKWRESQRPQPVMERRMPTEDVLRVIQKLRATVDHPNTDPQIRENARRKLDAYAERFGEGESGPEIPKQTMQHMTKKELALALIHAVIKGAAKNPKAFQIIEHAIHHTYGGSEVYLRQALNSLRA